MRLLSHRAYGFHSASALIAMIYLSAPASKSPSLTDESPPNGEESQSTQYGIFDIPELAAALVASNGPVLVSWIHPEIPDLAAHLPNVSPAVPKIWPGNRFDIVWVFVKTRTSNGQTGYRFSQVPQLLLPGDSSKPIGG